MKKEELIKKIAALKSEISLIELELDGIDSSLDQNQYVDHDDAEGKIQSRYEYIANEACEGSYNCGADEYKQLYQLIGNPDTFEATIGFEYNRHDKTYYYIDGKKYKFLQLVPV